MHSWGQPRFICPAGSLSFSTFILNVLKSLWTEKWVRVDIKASRFSATSTFTQDINTLLCTCVSHLCDAMRSSLSLPDLCASPLPPCLYLSGVLRSNYSRTTKMSEYTKSLNSSLNEKWKTNEKILLLWLKHSRVSRPVSLPCCFWTNGWNVEIGAECRVLLFLPRLFFASIADPIWLFKASSKYSILFDFADMSQWRLCGRNITALSVLPPTDEFRINADTWQGWELTSHKCRGGWENWYSDADPPPPGSLCLCSHQTDAATHRDTAGR